jgi:uncharacterized protein (TIGR02246 family)
MRRRAKAGIVNINPPETLPRQVMSHRILVLVVLLAACRSGGPESAPAPDPDLTARLEAQFARAAAAWNRGDLEAFMADYAPGEEPTFIAGGHLRGGHDWIRDHYAPAFAPGARRDSLRFEEFTVRPLSPAIALVTARYLLHRSGVVTGSGPFSLIMERRDNRWLILHDHSSSD